MSTTRRLILGAVALAAAGIAAFAGWYLLIRSDAPPEVDLAAAVSTLASAPATQPTSVPASTAPPTTAPAETTTTPPGTAAGGADLWVVDTAADSFVGYRVQEELANIGAATAVGRTPLVSGSLEIDGSTVSAVDVAADLTGLQSDESRRDRALRSRGLETDRFPTATFALAEPIDLGALPADGQQFAGIAVGDLTLHGVTRRVEVPIEGQLANGAIVVVGSLPVEFADYDIEAPTSFIALSVDDNGIIELQLVFRPA